MGWRLSGSDLSLGSAAGLAARGLRLHEGHAAAYLAPDTDLLVHSDAIPPDNPELRRAAELGIPTCSYFQMAGRLMSGKRGLAVAGTHGKSTTTAMAAHVFTHAACDPTVLCGAAPLGQLSGGRPGRGDLVLVEACEYRANFLHLRPAQAIILGIEPDHFDCFETPADLERAFARLAAGIPRDGLILARHDCPATRRVTAAVSCRVETFGIAQQADWSARRLTVRRGRYAFGICRHGRHILDVRLQIPGRHNVLNALAAAALAWENDVSADWIAQGLSSFLGLYRRFEMLGTWGGVTLVDDYAHHPTEVAATLRTLRQVLPGRRVWCIFQPHQASRTARLLDELAESLQNADGVVVAEIYRARERPIRSGNITAADLAQRVRAYCGGPGRPSKRPVEVPPVHDIAEIARLLETRLRAGDVLITMGAGDIRRICDGFMERFRENRAAG
jgi:UDP-N-acetylmuramate--alanine ligase